MSLSPEAKHTQHHRPHLHSNNHTNGPVTSGPRSYWGLAQDKYAAVVEMASMASLVLSIPSYMCVFLLCCAFPPFWPLMIGYVAYIWVDKSPENGSASDRYSHWFRSIFVWRRFTQYFPITLHKTVDLTPSFVSADDSGSSTATSSDDEDVPVGRNANHQNDWYTEVWKLTFWWYYYVWLKLSPRHHPANTGSCTKPTGKRYIFGFHPHGIISMGALGAFGTEGCNWSDMFPGVPVSVLTLSNQFKIPFYREMLLAMGLGSVSKRNCEALLNKNQSICIIVGGAQESLFARPARMDLVLNKRKGFVKLALETHGDVSLVPVLAFGENDIYEQADNDRGTWIFKCQQWLKAALGFTLPLLHARGVFNYDVGIMPYRRPIDVVVGEPIAVPYEPKATARSVEKYHGMYVEQLKRLFAENKAQFARRYNGRTPELRIIE